MVESTPAHNDSKGSCVVITKELIKEVNAEGKKVYN